MACGVSQAPLVEQAGFEPAIYRVRRWLGCHPPLLHTRAGVFPSPARPDNPAKRRYCGDWALPLEDGARFELCFSRCARERITCNASRPYRRS